MKNFNSPISTGFASNEAEFKTRFQKESFQTGKILLLLGLLICGQVKAQYTTNSGLPIAYWDFENNTTRTTLETTVEQQANTGNTYDGKFGGAITANFQAAGNGLSTSYGGVAAGSALLGQSWSTATTDPGTGATTYFQFTINTSGFSGTNVSFDAQPGTTAASYPYLGVLYSTNGGATYTAVGTLTTTNNTWTNNVSFTLPAAADNNTNVKIRIYGWFGANTAASTLRLDNMVIFATGTVAGSGSKTLLSESAVYTGYTSGKTGSQWLRYGTFTINTGTTSILGNGGIALGSTATAGAITVANGGTLDCGGSTDQTIFTVASGLSTVTIASGASLIVRNSGGIALTGATGSIQSTTRNFNAAGNYTYANPAGVAQITGTALPATLTGNLTINNPNGVTLTQATSIANPGILTLTSGKLNTSTTNTISLTNTAAGAVSGGSNTAFINGPLNRTLPAGLSFSAAVYNFPIGAGSTYLPYSITGINTGATSPILQVSAFAATAGGTPDNSSLSAISSTEYWQSKVISGNYSGASLSLGRQTAVAPAFNVIAKGVSTTSPATSYSSLGGTPGGNGVAGSLQTGTIAAGASQFNLFARSSFNITSSAGANGSISPSGTTNVTSNTDQSYTISPAFCYHIADVLIDGASVGAISNYIFSNVTTTHTISATFAINTYSATISPGANGTITPGSATVNCGSNNTYNIIAAECYHITDVTLNGTSQGAVNTLNVNNATANYTVAATFAINTYAITATSGANGTVTPAGASTINCAANATYTITPAACYSIADVLVDGVSNAAAIASGAYTFNNVTTNHTISATFTVNTYTITATSGVNGTVTPAGASTVNCGDNATYTITPVACYSIADVLVDGVSNAAAIASGTYTFNNVTGNHMISATFVQTTYTITATSGANGTVTPAGTSTVNCGDDATYTITPAACYSIADVLVDGQSVGALGTYSFTNVTANHTISATFTLNTYTITATSGANGTVTPAGTSTVNCGDDATYTITPAACYSIADVLVDGQSFGALATYTFTNVSANHTISATFTLNTYTITATSGANGTVTPAGASTVNCGDNANYTITPVACYSIADVLVDGVSNAAAIASGTYTFNNVTANHTISATFVQTTYTITATSGANGTVTPAGASTVNCGDNATYTITAAACYSIADVLVDGQSVGALGTYSFTNVTANHTISATFTLNTYTITATSGANGTVTPAGANTVNCGDNATYTITAAACYSIADVLVDGQSVGALATYTFTNVTTNHTISATFTLNTYTITATSGANGSVTPAGTSTVNCGDNATYTITPAACYSIADVLVDGQSVGALGNYSFTNVTANHAISATFVQTTYIITATSGANGSVTPTGASTVNCGDNATYTVTPAACYAIADVLVDGQSVGALGTYTFTNVTANHTISATFIQTTYTITASADTGGSVTPSGASTVICGNNATYTIAANSCFSITNVVVDGISQGAIATYTFTGVSANHTISATFTQVTYVITVSSGANGNITPGTGAVNCGANATYTITPAACYHVADVLVDGTSAGAVTSYTFTNVTSNHTISATFAANGPAATPVVTGVVNVCPYINNGSQITYTAVSQGATGFTWVTPPNVTIVSGQGTANLTVTFQAAFLNQANKQLRVTATSPCGNSSQIIYYLRAEAPVTPQPIIASSSEICPIIGTAGTITYKIPSVVGATSYLWSNPAGTNISHPNGTGINDTLITLSFTNAFATSALTVRAANDSCGASGLRSFTITRANPSQPGLISGPTNACPYMAPGGTAASYSIAPVTGATSYTWTAPGGAVITGQGTTMVSFTYPSSFTSGSVTVTATNGCGTSTIRSLAISKLLPAAPSAIDVIALAPCPDRVYSYTLSAMPANSTSVQWTVPAGGTITSGQGTTSITVSYSTAAINGNITAQALSNCGSSSIRVSMVKLPSCQTTRMEYVKGKTSAPALPAGMSVNVYPNPSVSDFHLQVVTAGKEAINVRILDLQGREYRHFTVQPNQTTTLGSDLKAGAYMMEVKQGNEVKTSRLIKF